MRYCNQQMLSNAFYKYKKLFYYNKTEQYISSKKAFLVSSFNSSIF